MGLATENHETKLAATCALSRNNPQKFSIYTQPLKVYEKNRMKLTTYKK